MKSWEISGKKVKREKSKRNNGNFEIFYLKRYIYQSKCVMNKYKTSSTIYSQVKKSLFVKFY